jgi:uncharacterized protein with HEPN domain
MTKSPPDAAKYLWDARRAAERISRFTAGRRFDDYLADEMVRAAASVRDHWRSLQRLTSHRSRTGRRDSDLPRIVAFRNVLIHGYATVDDQLVWGVVERDLPTLLATITRMLTDIER